MTDTAHTQRPKLLLTEGGPAYWLEKWVGLIDERSPRIVRRAILSIFVTWIPLFVLCLLHETAYGDRVAIPFLKDYASYARFLLALPLLVFAETVLGPHLAHAAAHFVSSGLVVEEDFKHFDKSVEEGLRWRDSTVAEIIILLVAYFAAFSARKGMAVPVSTWYAHPAGTGFTLTLAGWWFAFFCVPLFQFLLLRWLWRLFLWGQFLWRMSRLHLQLTPTHPDEAAGLGFVGEAHRFFSIIPFAFSISAAGVLANDVIFGKTPLPHFGPLIAAFVILLVILFLLPLAVFAPILLRTKRRGLYEYGSLATEYTTSFQKKWVETRPPREEVLLGTGDIQSLADLGNSFGFIEKMGPLPMDHRTPITLVAACLIPMAPLLLTMMPLKDLLKLVFKLVM